MKFNSLKIFSVLLVIAAFTAPVQSRDISVSVLPEDIVTYQVKDLTDAQVINLSQLPVIPYSTDKPFAVVSNIKEVQSDALPGNDLENVSLGLITSPTTGFAISDDGLTSFTISPTEEFSDPKSLDNIKQEDAKSL
jgi:hypothetical protein